MRFGVRLSKLSGHPGNHQQDSSMPPTSPVGTSSACNSSVILCPPVDMVLQFLTTLYEEGLGYSARNTSKSALFAVVFSNSISKRNLSHPPLWNLRAVCHLIPLSFFLSFSTKSSYPFCLVIFLLIVMVHISSLFSRKFSFFLMYLVFLYGSC